MTEQQLPAAQNLISEEFITLTKGPSNWREKAACLEASDEEMCYESKANGRREGTTRAERMAIAKYCGPCAVQEICLSNALLTKNVTSGVVGGLSSIQRDILVSEVNPETGAIKTTVWQKAIDTVLDMPRPLVKAKRGTQRGYVKEAECRQRILTYLAEQPEATLNVDEQLNVYKLLANELDLTVNSVRTMTAKLVGEGMVAAERAGQKLAVLKLVA